LHLEAQTSAAVTLPPNMRGAETETRVGGEDRGGLWEAGDDGTTVAGAQGKHGTAYSRRILSPALCRCPW